MKKLSLSLILSMIILACNKPKDPVIPPIDPVDSTGNTTNLTCKPISFFLTSVPGYTMSDENIYDSLVYDASGKITDVYWSVEVAPPVPTSSRNFSYNGFLPVGWQSRNSGDYQTIKYNGSNISEIMYVFEPDKVYDSITYVYTGGKVSRKDYLFVSGWGTLRSKRYMTYHYNTAGNMDKKEYYTDASTKDLTIDYSYDTTSNKLYQANPRLFTYFYSHHSPEERLYEPFFVSDKLINKLTTVSSTGTDTYNITYNFNANGYPVDIKINGKVALHINYECK